MAHFALVHAITGKVLNVIVLSEEEAHAHPQAANLVQTSYNTREGVHYQEDKITPSADQSKALRKNYAQIGGTYDAQRDAFIPSKPFDKYVLDEDKCIWVPPIPYPADMKTLENPSGTEIYDWDDVNGAWVHVGKPLPPQPTPPEQTPA